MFKTKEVRDLAWVIKSPVLLNISSSDVEWLSDSYFEKEYERLKPKLVELDKTPQVLIDHLDSKSPRLGHYFENLWAFYIQHFSDYEIVFRNKQIFKNKQSIGELDLVLYDQQNDQYIHMELALKFYLAYGVLSSYSHFHGPNLNDRLDLKYNHLMNKQIRLTERNETKAFLSEHNISITKRIIVMKGRLFYRQNDFNECQSINPNHEKSIWLTHSEFKKVAEYQSMNWQILKKKSWISTEDEEAEIHNAENLLKMANQSVYIRSTGKNSVSFILVTDDWLEELSQK